MDLCFSLNFFVRFKILTRYRYFALTVIISSIPIFIHLVKSIEKSQKAKEIKLPEICAENFTGFQQSLKSVFFRSKTCKLLKPKLTEEHELELKYPLAFSILVHGDAGMLEFLLQRIYKPFNSYCIHIDKKSDVVIKETIKFMAMCYEKYFNSSNIKILSEVSVSWGSDTILLADLKCQKYLYDFSKSWKILVNIAGSEFPLKDNLAIVRKYLESGKSIEKGVSVERVQMTNRVYEGRLQYFRSEKKLKKPQRRVRAQPPFNVSLYKGQRSGIFSREWIKFLLYNPVSEIFLKWSLDSAHTEEHFVQTMTMIESVDWTPQHGYIVHQRENFVSDPIVKATWWSKDVQCHGKWRHNVCVYGLKDVPKVLNHSHEGVLFANKFQSNVDSNVIPCLINMLDDEKRTIS